MFLMLFTHYLFGYVGTIICSIGLILALCSVYIFTRRQMRSAVATYLAGLSISDSCLLSLGLVIAINSSIPPKQQSELFYSSHIHKYLFPYVYACIIWFQFTSVWITIGFAIDRWFAIKWPILHYTYSSKRACYIVLAIYCLGFIYSFPRFFEYKTEMQHVRLFLMDNITEDVDYLVVTNKFLNNRLYHYIVHLVLYSVFQSILPLLMLSYFNVELIRSINASSNFLKRFTSLYAQSTRLGRDTPTSRYREGTITRSVVCLIGLFILCQVPASVLHYIHMFYRNHPVLYICYDISNFLILVNSAVNFFIFTYFNRKFRRELARVCFHGRKSRDPILRTASHQSFPPTNSYARTAQQNFDITPGSSWEYQKRNTRPLLYSDSGESINHLRKKSSNLSIECERNSIRGGRYSTYDSKYLKSRSDYQQRRSSERLAFYQKKPSLTINHAEPNLHYMTYKHEKNKPKTNRTHNSITYSTTGSENSSSIDQNKLLKPMLNTTEKSNRYFRK